MSFGAPAMTDLSSTSTRRGSVPAATTAFLLVVVLALVAYAL
jgi:hypothetical protein